MPPQASSPQASIQLRMTATHILGSWDDKHYLWDNTPEGKPDLHREPGAMFVGEPLVTGPRIHPGLSPRAR